MKKLKEQLLDNQVIFQIDQVDRDLNQNQIKISMQAHHSHTNSSEAWVVLMVEVVAFPSASASSPLSHSTSHGTISMDLILAKEITTGMVVRKQPKKQFSVLR